LAPAALGIEIPNFDGSPGFVGERDGKDVLENKSMLRLSVFVAQIEFDRQCLVSYRRSSGRIRRGRRFFRGRIEQAALRERSIAGTGRDEYRE
jgi:hypothetical protein